MGSRSPLLIEDRHIAAFHAPQCAELKFSKEMLQEKAIKIPTFLTWFRHISTT